MNYTQQTSNKRKPPATFDLLPEHFADTWGGKRPVTSVAIGLRIPSEREVLNAQLEANRAAEGREQEEAELIRVSKLLAFVVARGICSPHDVSEPHPFFELAEDEVPAALKGPTIQRIYDEIERIHVEQSPVFAEATDDDLRLLAEVLLTDEPTAHLSPTKSGHARRYLKFALDLIRDDES